MRLAGQAVYNHSQIKTVPDFRRAKILAVILYGPHQGEQGARVFRPSEENITISITSSWLLYLHEHAKSSFKEIGEARRHVFDIHRL